MRFGPAAGPKQASATFSRGRGLGTSWKNSGGGGGGARWPGPLFAQVSATFDPSAAVVADRLESYSTDLLFWSSRHHEVYTDIVKKEKAGSRILFFCIRCCRRVM